MKQIWTIFLATLSLAAAMPIYGQESPTLKKGLNLSCWLSSALRQPLDKRDFKLIKEAGFDHVRLPYNPEAFGYRFRGEEVPVEKVDFAPLDQAMEEINKAGLQVILDMHLLDADMAAIEGRENGAEERLAKIWKTLAHRYKSYPAGMLAFELLNEPQYYNKQERYQQLARKLVDAVRGEAPDHLLIVNSAWGGSINGLMLMEWVNDKNLIYAFHYYLPYIITHQGIHMGDFNGEPIRHFRKVPYPADLLPENPPLDIMAPQAPDPATALASLEKYRKEGWNRKKVREEVKRAADWAAKHKLKVICTEFGVLKTKILPDSRFRWIADTRQALEEFGIGWSLWDYTDLFGIVELKGETSTDPGDFSVRFKDPAKGVRAFDGEALSSLGMK